jgi:hypothetical protein
MGFLFVRYTHGKKEYGKDFTFSELTPFGDHRHSGLQAKAGDISGGTLMFRDMIMMTCNWPNTPVTDSPYIKSSGQIHW